MVVMETAAGKALVWSSPQTPAQKSPSRSLGFWRKVFPSMRREFYILLETAFGVFLGPSRGETLDPGHRKTGQVAYIKVDARSSF